MRDRAICVVTCAPLIFNVDTINAKLKMRTKPVFAPCEVDHESTSFCDDRVRDVFHSVC